MEKDIALPAFGSSMKEGLIVTVLVEKGQKVSKGDKLFELETDKASYDMECPEDGTVSEIFVQQDQTVPVGEPVIRLEIPDSKESGNFHIVRLSGLGDNTDEAVVAEISYKLGDHIKSGSIIAEVETDKAAFDIVSEKEGYLRELLTNEGDLIKNNCPAAVIGPKTGELPEDIKKEIEGFSDNTELPEGFEAVKLPRLGEETKTAVISALLCEEGEKVQKSDPLIEIETDKAAMEVESHLNGTVEFILAEEGEEQAVDAVLVIVKTKQTESSISQDQIESIKQHNQNLLNEAKKNEPDTFSFEEFEDMQEGQISDSDVNQSLNISPETPRKGETLPLSRVQKIIGERMVFSKQNIPCFYLNSVADLTELIEFRKQLNSSGDVKVSFNDLIMKAAADAMKDFPLMTGQAAGDHIKLAEEISVGIAVDTGEALLVPVCKNAAGKTLRETALANQKLIEKAQKGSLTAGELEGASTAITNLGNFEIDWFIPIVPPGQTSIIGVGRIKETLTKRGSEIQPKQVCTLTISVDHKVVNGAYAAQYMDKVRQILESPNEHFS
ncbi:Dihydrolipoyllysine-residue acetyltransferase component of pyruvate dehydrogenase complex [Sedimentisphaera cyanobacteriorum]|uniref:Dihydrolipoamide acetyltransferase component of pyruvate dehydrogenase complex n=1 Tax=Sedimentisphaera cyanobacteriorum TaxID=1940790 RepID=A0A1Q2HN91_9BACT|nr:2-oxo acid dehydrogenase subunit E2 [Sedimentisphaera cyanobacteriorum]AQQ08918.1 Dihydrolipoyllysine-residue acetyltransferase component of pyruvate dehydrogenase complex [Sedimentisphaera cyanobacteriorum]